MSKFFRNHQPGHLDDSVLLAYTRKQPLADREYEHIRTCPVCRLKCEEYKEINNVLAVLAQVQYFYPPVADRVLQSIQQEEEDSREASWQVVPRSELKPRLAAISPRRVLRPVIAIPVVLLCLLFITVAVYLWGVQNTTAVKPPVPTSSTTGAPSLPLQPTMAPTPVKHSSKHGATQAPPAAKSSPTPATQLIKCGTSGGSGQFYVKICGRDFHPGDQLVVVITSSIGGVQQLHVTVDARGQCEVSFPASALDFPLTVYAIDQSNNTKTAPVQISQ